MSAEDQALIAGLKNVPKGANLLGHELSTDQAFLDWQLRLAAEAMADAAEKAENHYHSVEKAKQDEWEQWIGQVYTDENEILDVGAVNSDMISESKVSGCEENSEKSNSVLEKKYPERDGSQVEAVLDKWYKACLDWYDIWEEMHPYVEDHKEEFSDAELNMKIREAEDAVKDEKAWLSLDELKKQVGQ